jgi:glucosyl-3-phosphoglycerate phosphatase
MYLVIVRHGEADGNTERRLLGWLDVSLSAHGRDEAKAVAYRLAAFPVVRVISSDLARAWETAQPIAEGHGLEVTADPRLREIANGEWTGLLPEEVARRWPRRWDRLLRGDDFRRPGGESWAEVRARAVEAVTDIPLGGDDEVTVLVTHGGTALSILGWAAGLPPGRDAHAGPFAPLRTGSLSVLALPGVWIVAVNDTGHLPGPAAPSVRTWIRKEHPGTR